MISLMEYSNEELECLLQLAIDIKMGKIDTSRLLQNKTIGLLFNVPSTRTRISFQAAARQLGGHAEYLNASDLQLANKESLKDTAAVMSRYLDAIIVRMYNMNEYGEGRRRLDALAEYADIPIINALDEKDHPCQVIADVLTLKEKFGESYKQKKIVFTWGYSERRKSLGVPHSFMTAASILGMNLVIAHPPGFELESSYVDFANQQLCSSGGTLTFSHDLKEASEDASVIYMKNWASLNFNFDEEKRVKENIRSQWCVSEQHFKRANDEAYYMDCLPTIRGEGVTSEVIDGQHSIVYDQAENRLHAQKAILTQLLKKYKAGGLYVPESKNSKREH